MSSPPRDRVPHFAIDEGFSSGRSTRNGGHHGLPPSTSWSPRPPTDPGVLRYDLIAEKTELDFDRRLAPARGTR